MSGTSRNLFAHLPASPIIVGLGPPDGNLRVEWAHFFAQLWNRTGGAVSGGALAGDAPSDGHGYGRLNAAWVQVLPLAGTSTITGIVNAPTAAAGTNSTQIATTAYADNLGVIGWG